MKERMDEKVNKRMEEGVEGRRDGKMKRMDG